MKHPGITLFSAAILAICSAQVGAEPLATVTVRSYADLTNAITRFASNLHPNSPADASSEFSKGLGLNAADFDAKRPWELAVWYDGNGGEPLFALKAPVQNVSRFKDSLGAEGPLRAAGRDWSQLGNGWGLVTFKEATAMSESERTALGQWKSAPPPQPTRLVELNLRLSEPLRQQALTMLSFARMSISQAVTSQPGLANAGLNPQAMEELLNTYFDLLNSLIAGFQQAKLGLDMDATAVSVDQLITAQPDSELAQALKKPAYAISAQDLKGLDSQAPVSFAAAVGKQPGLLKVLQKFTLLGFQMQNTETNAPVVKEVQDLLASMLPMTFSGSVYFNKGFGFQGAYRFPAGNVDELYAKMKHLATTGLQAQVGKDKMYSAITLAEKDHTVAGLAVDRFTLTLNQDSPLFRQPGQKAQLEAWWPNGKIEFDYAVKDGLLLAASPDRVKDLVDSLSAPATQKPAFRVEPTTCLAGYLNVLGVAKQMMAANPIIPGPVKEKLSRLEPQGTGLEFEMNLDGKLHNRARVPLKLFRELGRLKDN